MVIPRSGSLDSKVPRAPPVKLIMRLVMDLRRVFNVLKLRVLGVLKMKNKRIILKPYHCLHRPFLPATNLPSSSFSCALTKSCLQLCVGPLVGGLGHLL